MGLGDVTKLFGGSPGLTSLWQVVYTILSWDIVKGGIVFVLGVALASQAIGLVVRRS